MDILTEQAPTYNDCLAKIHKEYGPNIEVFRHKNIKKGGILGLFEKEAVEIQFFIKNKPVLSDTLQNSRSSYGSSSSIQGGIANVQSSSLVTSDSFVSNTPRIKNFEEERQKILKQAQLHSPEIAQKLEPIISKRDVDTETKNSSLDVVDFEQLIHKLNSIESKVSSITNYEQLPKEQYESITGIEDLLEQNDFTSSYIKMIVEKIKNEFTVDQLNDFKNLQTKVVEWIGKSINVSPIESFQRPRIIALVGPTGVGKTTTVAKLAASYLVHGSNAGRSLNVQIATIDNYRIGAKQQMEIYGSIMKVPVFSAEKPFDLQTFIASNMDADIILIDTIGNSPKDFSKISEVKNFLSSIESISDMYLVLSATTKASDMKEIMQKYSVFDYNSLIVTKFDETTKVGNIISVLHDTKIPIAYLTTGQRVPHDFETATRIQFLKHLVGFEYNTVAIEQHFPVLEKEFLWR